MSLFTVIAPAESPPLQAAVEKAFPDAHFTFAPGQFFVVGNKLTTTQVKEQLGVGTGKLGRVLILRVDNWGGWHSKDMWEWLRNHERDIADAADNG